MKSCKRILLGLLLPALLLLAWWWTTTYTDISHAILPSIPEVWRTLREFLADLRVSMPVSHNMTATTKASDHSAVPMTKTFLKSTCIGLGDGLRASGLKIGANLIPAP